MCQEEQIWKVPSYPCIFSNLMPQCRVKVTNILWTYVWSSCYSCYALILYLRTLVSGSSRKLHAGEAVGGVEGDISRGTMGASSQYPRPSIPTSKTDNILSYKTHLRNIHTMMGWVCVFFFYSVLPVASLASLKAYIIFCLGGSGKRDKTLYHKDWDYIIMA